MLRNHPTPSPYVDPIETYVPLFLKLAAYGFLVVIFFQATDAFAEYTPGKAWPGLLNVIRTFTFLPIHEAGHFFFGFAGRTVMLLAGSGFQILIPFVWCVVATGQRSQTAPVALFWVGENCMDVSLYIRDAQYRALPLLGGSSTGHDWYNLLRGWDALGSADTIADIVFYTGMAISLAAIVTGVAMAVYMYARALRPARLQSSVSVPPASTVEELLDASLVKRNRTKSI